MAYCTVGERECSNLDKAIGHFWDAEERGEKKESAELECQDGFALAKDCGEIAICGFDAAEAHPVETEMIEGERNA